MKKKLRSSIWICLLVLAWGCSGNQDHVHSDVYTCPMHPTVTSDRPGTCPVCGMDLVRKARPGEELAMTDEIVATLKAPNEQVLSNIRTVRGEYTTQPVRVTAQGVAIYDTRRSYLISSRVAGRLERLYLRYEYQPVRKGQKVAEIYSPELVAAQRELIQLLGAGGNAEQVESAKQRLSLLGATDAQIEGIVQSRNAISAFPVVSPYDGFVIATVDEPAPTQPSRGSTASAMNSPMGAAPTMSSSATEANAGWLREGEYVSAGQTLFRIVDARALRIELSLPAALFERVRVNDKVALTIEGTRHETTIDLVQPFFEEGEDFVKVRVDARGINHLMAGQWINAIVEAGSLEGMWLPAEAVLDQGMEQLVFVKSRGVFRPKAVVGIRLDGKVQIKAGLASGDDVAANARFLVDSESFIKTMR